MIQTKLVHKSKFSNDEPRRNPWYIPSMSESKETREANANPDNWEDPWKFNEQWVVVSESYQDFLKQCAEEAETDPVAVSFPLPIFGKRVFHNNTFLVRDSYIQTFERIWSMAFDGTGSNSGVLVTGYPGLGKTTFLYYMLIRLLQQKQVVAFCADEPRPLLFFKGTVYQSINQNFHLPKPRSSGEVFLWSLFDLRRPDSFNTEFILRDCFPVQTCEPSPARFSWWVKNHAPTILGLPLWSREELLQGLKHQPTFRFLVNWLGRLYVTSRTPPQHERKRILSVAPRGTRRALDALFEKYPADTPSPTVQQAFETLVDAAIPLVGHSIRDVRHAVRDLDQASYNTYAVLNERIDMLETRVLRPVRDFRHPIPDITSEDHLAIHPIFRAEGCDRWVLDFKSEVIRRSVMKRLHNEDDESVRRKLDELKVYIDVGTDVLVERVAGVLAHRRIAQAPMPGEKGFLSLQPLVHENPGGIDERPVFIPSTPKSTPHSINFPRTERRIEKLELKDSIPNSFEPNLYYLPLAADFPMFDAFMVDLDHPNHTANLWILQMVASQFDGGSSSGYSIIRKIVHSIKCQLSESGRCDTGESMDVDSSPALPEPVVNICYVLIKVASPIKGDLYRSIRVGHQKDTDDSKEWCLPKGWSENKGDVYWAKVTI